MSGDVVELVIANGIARLTLNKPEKLNAIDWRMAEQIVDALSTIEFDASVRAVILSGNGRAFMAGGDLREFHAAGERAPAAVKALIAPFHDIIRRIRKLPVPVIAGVHGAVAGGGVALALACDFVIASDDAVFTPAYLSIATNPDGGTTWSVVNLVGERRALEWLMLGEPMSSRRALDLGLVNRVVASEDLATEAMGLAVRIAAGPAQAQASLKQLIWQASTTPLTTQLEAEAAGFLALSATEDFREGVAAFIERRDPHFETARRLDEAGNQENDFT